MSNPTTPLVHTPYNATCDMVPYGSEEAMCDSSIVVNEPNNSSCGQSVTTSDSAELSSQHSYLNGQAEFLEIPADPSSRIEQVPPSSRLFRLFIGHIRFETTPAELRWIVFMLTGVTCGKIETRGLGCFMVFFSNYDEMWRVKGLHKRVLFDHNGVWFARNESQESAVQHYVTHYVPQLQNCRLPKGLMVVDEETSRKRHKKGKASAAHDPRRSGPTSVEAAKQILSQTVPVPVPIQPQQPMLQFAAPISHAQQFWNVASPLY